MKKVLKGVIASVGFAGLLCSGSLSAESQQEHSDALEKGEAHYLFFCANCHGINADGKGAYADLLKITPSDLTVLKQAGDESISDRVLKAIGGRHEVGEGQEKNMPIFSDNLEVKTVYEISVYLNSIQK